MGERPKEVQALAGRLAKLNMTVNKCRQLRLRERADFGGFDGAILEYHQRRYAANPILGRRALILVDVELCYFQAAGIFLGHLVEDGRDHFAGTTPLRPVINEDRRRTLQDLGLERVIGY